MNKKHFIFLLGCILISTTILATLYAISPLSKEIYRGGFDRTFTQGLFEKSVLDIKFNSFYIAGVTKDKVYLGNTTAPLHLLLVNPSLTDSQHVRLKVRLDSIREPKRFKLLVDSPYFFMTHGVEPQILRGTIGKWYAEPIMRDSAYYFVEATPISSSTFALRSYSLLDQGYELAKKTLDSLDFNNELLVKQVDGLFCVDGKLHYNKRLNRLVYLHFYRNEFIVADTNLLLQYRGHTIDTFRHAMIKVSKLKNGSQSMMSAPPAQTNGLSCVSGNYLFVQSAVLARNEDPEDMVTNSIIDVYDLVSGGYIDSFLIPKYQNQPMRSFEVLGNKVFALCGHHLILYELMN